ncbi:hypothetical protein ACHAPT_006018 [Fusarium lateritium]
MLLTLRIISIDGPVEVSLDKESVSGETDDQLSRAVSSHGDLGEGSDISVISSYHREEAEKEHWLEEPQDIVPDHDETITWDHVHNEDDAPIDDFLHRAVEQGAFQSHSGGHSSRGAGGLWTVINAERKEGQQPGQTTSDDEGAYHVAWKAFQRLSQGEQCLAWRAFQWVSCSISPLDDFKLSMVMLIDPNSDEVDELNGEAERLLRRGGIRDLCGSLLTYDGQEDRWRFKDASAEQYFHKNHSEISQSFAFVAMACLKFLTTNPCAASRSTCWCAGNASPTETSNQGLGEALCSFIRRHVVRYVQEAERSPTIHDKRLAVLERRFLGEPRASSLAYQTWAEAWGRTMLTDEDGLKPVWSPLFAMAAFGLQRLLSDWWLDPRTNVNAYNSQGNSLLDLAVINEKHEIQRLIAARDAALLPNKGVTPPVSSYGACGPGRVQSQSIPVDNRPGSSVGTVAIVLYSTLLPESTCTNAMNLSLQKRISDMTLRGLPASPDKKEAP